MTQIWFAVSSTLM